VSLTFEHGLTAPARHFLTHIVDRLMTARDRQRRYLAIRRTRRKLHELPDWILRDIGLCRGDIEALHERASENPGDGSDRLWQLLP
jgi:uncharacterized protein YjiS (DUF1127 family)